MKDEGLKPADPVITYGSIDYNSKTDVRDCINVKNVVIRENGMYEVSITAQVELLKEPSEPIKEIRSGVELLDKNGARICGISNLAFFFEGLEKVGDVSSESCTLDTDMLASKVIEEAKFYRIINVYGLKKSK